MTRKGKRFDYMEGIMRYYCQWYDEGNTVMGKLTNAYSVCRIVLVLALLVAASAQLYCYGMSYLVHESAIFMPLGILSVTVNISLAWNFRSILYSANQFEFHLNSFVDEWEKKSIEKRMQGDKIVIVQIVRVIDFYVWLTVVTHTSSILLHSLFGLFPKPVVLPLLFEKFLEGDMELRPQLVAVVIASLVYVKLLSSMVMVIALAVYFLGAASGTLEVLIRRLETLSDKTNDGCEKLEVDSDLSDTIRKHAGLLNIFNGLMDWLGFPLSFTVFSCSILFCINAITTKQSLGNKEYSSFLIWGTFLLVAASLAYIVCSRGQEIEIKSEELLTAIYNLPWHRESAKSRRNVLMMLVEGNRLITLDFKGLMRINMFHYSEMMKTSYSYFMLLTSSD